MIKKLTEELIQGNLKDKGISIPGETNLEDKIKYILKQYGAEFVHDWRGADWYFYPSTTADGYEVWIATENYLDPNFEEDVYYYQTEWLNKLPEAIMNGCVIQIDEWMDGYEFEEAITMLYEEIYVEEYEEIEQALIDAGYEYE